MNEPYYPSENTLNKIKQWDILKWDSVLALLDFIEQEWRYSENYYKLSGKRVLRLELHTAGWSGNEDIIVSLRNTPMFWLFYWQKSVRGGHYYFKIKRMKGQE